MSEEISYCGFVAIVGRPNIGKSTLLNQLIGKKVSITSRKPQTTRYRIKGIYTDRPYQVIYLDTPGLHSKETRAINRLMNRVAHSSLYSVDMVIFMVENLYWTDDDERVVNQLRNIHCPVVLAINKVDIVLDKEKLLPHMKFLSQKMHFYNILPICAENGMNVSTLKDIVHKALPAATHCFPEYYITDRSQRFMAAEIIREKLIRFLGAELPYSVTVEIVKFFPNDTGTGGYNIYALILVERNSQKKIVIGENGSKIKRIGMEARHDMESLLGTCIHLDLWVKVKEGWADDEKTLRNLGYVDDIVNLF